MRSLDHLPLRVRLVAGFSAAMLVLLTAAGAFVYWRVEYALDRSLDTELASATSVVEPLVGDDGSVSSPEAATATGAGWQVLDAAGGVLDSGGPAADRSLIPASELGTASTLDVGSFLPAGDAPYRVRVSTLTGTGDAAYLLVGVRRDHRDEALRELLLQLVLAGLGALVVASLVGDQLARLALRPVERYRSRASEIADGAPGLRLDVPPNRADEVTRLGDTLNEMLAALEAALDRERQFVSEASHELRTPLTLLKSRIQLAARRSRSVEEHEQVLDELAVDVQRLVDLADALLSLEQSPVSRWGDLANAASAVVARWYAANPDRTADLALSTDRPVVVALDDASLERVVDNLVTNAFAHGAAPVTVTVTGSGELRVTDAGAGMPPDFLAQATRRFTRAPEARSRPGAGLGLSIVDQLVTVAGGRLLLENDVRMTVTVRLPVRD